MTRLLLLLLLTGCPDERARCASACEPYAVRTCSPCVCEAGR
jgi:hypothetical protein